MKIQLSVSPKRAIEYRKDIDGLRGIAILSVFFYHLFPEMIPGGFIGVDIFFVISGFLISKIIFSKLSSNTFRFIDFYIRRIKRIFPALILVSFICLFYGFLVLFPDEFISLGKHLRSASLFLSNLTLYREIGYFDLASEYKPLLHLWSLAVEEQFYLAWPLILWGSYKVSSYHRLQIYQSQIIFTVIFCVTLGSFLMNLYLNLILQKQNLAFYCTGTRLWEMSIGSLGAYYSLSRKKIFSKFTFDGLSVLSFFIIIFALIFLDHNQRYFSLLIIFPLTSVLFFLVFHENSSFILLSQRIFKNRLLIFMGLISYPMYLLHWPFISFSKIIAGRDIKGDSALLIFFLVMGISYGVYKYIERPIRKTNSSFIVGLLGICFLLSGTLGHFSYKKFILPYLNYILPHSVKITNAMNEWEFPTAHMKKIVYKGEVFYKIGDSKNIVLFFGDSNAEQYAPRIDKIITETKNSNAAVFATWGGICPLPNVGRVDREVQFVNKVMDYACSPEIQTVIITGQWFGYLSGKAKNYLYDDGNLADDSYLQKALNDFQNFIEQLIAQGKKVYIISSIPYGKDYGPKSFFTRNFRGIWTLQPRHVDRKKWDKEHLKAKNILVEISKKTGAFLISPEVFLCSNDFCLTYTADGFPLYKDEGHLASHYVKEYVTFLDFFF